MAFASKNWVIDLINKVLKKKSASTITTLWTGELSTNGNIVLSDDYSNYDIIVFEFNGSSSNTDYQQEYRMFLTDNVVINKENQFIITGYSSEYVQFYYTDSKTINIKIRNGSFRFISVKGIKF